jgi:response regulator of citrate/malate metabolism
LQELNAITIMRRCLIIDDDSDDQEIFLMCVKKIDRDIDCQAMSSAIDAIAMLGSNKEYVPDYIFLDVNMPKLNGIDCLKALRNMKHLKFSKIFIYSTTSDGSALNESRRLGASDFIVKPSKTTELKEKLAKIFSIVSGIHPD